METSSLERSIIGELPQIPFIIDQVGEAIKWAKEAYAEGKLVKILQNAAEVAKWVTSISEPNFYRTYLVTASIISEIPNVLKAPEFKAFESASNSVEHAIEAILVDKEETEKRGCFNALTIHLVQLAQKDEECLALMLFNILSDLKEVTAGIHQADVKTPITPQDYITILGYALVMANVRMSNLNLLDYNRKLINDIEVILNNEVIY